ncbi:MAG TPA: hypothetical protein VFV79_11060 [Saprospiraceae bacterium]|nr:hypothetical protein [Saprospiraceae bacterium]
MKKEKAAGGYLWPFSFLGLPSLKINAFPDDDTLEEIPVLPVPPLLFRPTTFCIITASFKPAGGCYKSSSSCSRG